MPDQPLPSYIATEHDLDEVMTRPSGELVSSIRSLSSFGTQQDPARTWAVNTLIPSYCVEHYAGARIVALSTTSSSTC